MKIEQEQINSIRTKFEKLRTKNDLVELLNDAKKVLYDDQCNPITLKSLTFYANPALSAKRYVQFSIKKKSGGERIINAPNVGLKSILRSLNFVLQCMYEPHNAANGFVIDKSIVDNANVHIAQKYVYNLDLKDFFHSFDRNRVKMGFYRAPFKLTDERKDLAFLLACLCTHPLELDGETKTVLPQGSPTSPTITNILCAKLDHRLSGLAKRFGAKYTRYADDITFSAQRDVFKKRNFTDELNRIISEDQQLVINPAKTRLKHASEQQEVTGLIVNEKVNVRLRYVKQLRMWLYYWEKYGYDKAQTIFMRDYKAEKGHVKKGNPNMDNVIAGKLEFLKMVKGEQDSTYKKLMGRFDKLTGNGNQLEAILTLWETEGIEKAMELYYKHNTVEVNNKLLIKNL